MTEVVKTYVNHDMLQGLQYHLDILKSQILISPNWKDFDVSKWNIVEQLQKPIQKDSSSCGLFMLKFMEYWTGYALSYPITQIHILVHSNGDFILFILDKDTHTVHILDPTPIDPIYQYNPHAKYLHRLIWIAEYLSKAMSKACPGSRWNENILLWRHKIVDDIPVYNRELSGYLITLYMSTWEDGKLHLPFLKDGYELRKQILGHLLTLEHNESEDGMPTGVLDFINCIRMKKLSTICPTAAPKLSRQS
uniref:Ubiquitin-like protease family profile domain-containing protein n=2 Tax=Triticum urartu TaxID=4572 RepID=A0A8R7TI60_TRIUA